MPTAPKMMRTDVYDQLKERLFTGELRTGQFVSQRELATLLGATLNPVREAIRKLEAEGLINVYAQKGIQIIEGGPKAINDAYDYRQLLEANAIRYFARHADEATIDATLEKIKSAIDVLKNNLTNAAVRWKVLDNDYEFHKDLVDFQDNAIISKHYSLNAARLRLFRVSIGQPLQRLDEAAHEHLDILDACRARDSELAARRLAQHIEISREHALGIRPMRALGEEASPAGRASS